MFSLWSYVPYRVKPKDGTPQYALLVWSLIKNNLTWEDAKKERRNFKKSEIVPRVFDVPKMDADVK